MIRVSCEIDVLDLRSNRIDGFADDTLVHYRPH